MDKDPKAPRRVLGFCRRKPPGAAFPLPRTVVPAHKDDQAANMRMRLTRNII